MARRGCTDDVADECGLDGIVRDSWITGEGTEMDGWTVEYAPASRSAFVAASKPIYMPLVRITKRRFRKNDSYFIGLSFTPGLEIQSQQQKLRVGGSQRVYSIPS